MRNPEPPKDPHRMARAQRATTTLINKQELNVSHNMTQLGGALSLLGIVCLAGCMSVNPYSMNREMEQSVSHSMGYLTDRDVAAEIFQKNSGATGRQIILINYARWDASKTKSGPGKQYYDPNPRASQTEARRILAYVLSSHFCSNPGVTNTMAVLVCGVSDKAKAYQLRNAPLPTYVVSSAGVEDGEILQDTFSANLFKLTQATSGTNVGHVANLFPFEPLDLDLFWLRPDYYDPINEFRTHHTPRNRQRPSASDGKKTREEWNDYTRDTFTRKVTASWPKLLGDGHLDSDILVVAWNNVVGGAKTWRGHDMREQIPYKSMTLWDTSKKFPGPNFGASMEIRCARVSAKDGIVYYYKTALPKDGWSVEQAMEEMGKRYPNRR